MPFREALEHMIAVTYGVTYDAVVTHFPPYEAMLEEIVAFVARSVHDATAPRATRVLDVACGIGNVTLRLAREGYSVVGIDGVKHLVEIAREKSSPRGTNLTFQHLDIARDTKPGGHAIFLTYERPAGLTTFHEVRAAEGLGAAVRALRWLLPTMTFEFFRESEHRYLSVAEFHETLSRAGFEVLEARQTFLSGLSRLAWCRAK